MSPEEVDYVGSAANLISNSGKGSVITCVLLQHFMKFNMNGILSNVRNLQFITHLMIM